MGLKKRKSRKQLTLELEIQKQQIERLSGIVEKLQKEVDRISVSKNYVENLITDFENNIKTELDEKIKGIDNKITDLTEEKLKTPDASQIIKEWYFGAEEATNE